MVKYRLTDPPIRYTYFFAAEPRERGLRLDEYKGDITPKTGMIFLYGQDRFHRILSKKSIDYSVFANGKVVISGPNERECIEVFTQLRKELGGIRRSWLHSLGRTLQSISVRLESEVDSKEESILTESINKGVKDQLHDAQIQNVEFFFRSKGKPEDIVKVYLKRQETNNLDSLKLAITVEASKKDLALNIINSLMKRIII